MNASSGRKLTAGLVRGTNVRPSFVAGRESVFENSAGVCGDPSGWIYKSERPHDRFGRVLSLSQRGNDRRRAAGRRRTSEKLASAADPSCPRIRLGVMALVISALAPTLNEACVPPLYNRSWRCRNLAPSQSSCRARSDLQLQRKK